MRISGWENGIYLEIDTDKETIIKSSTGPGDKGPQGEKGTKNDLLLHRGIWKSGTYYNPLDVVIYEGETYICEKDNIDKSTNDKEYWTLLSLYSNNYCFEEAIKEMRKGTILQCQYGIYKIENNKFMYISPDNIENLNINWKESAISVTHLLEEKFTRYNGGRV